MTALEAFASQLNYSLDGFQQTACELLAAGRSVLVAAPTGSGKTTVAEFAVYLSRSEQNARVFYTTPIKALSNQKFHELCTVYGAEEVGLLTGDVQIRADAPIIVMTTEVLRNMIYEQSEALNELAFVVLDEVHYLGDRHRGAVWEEIILHLPTSIRIVALSATVSNAEEFGDWMHAVRGDTDVVLSEYRPVPLYQHVLTPKALFPLHVTSSGEAAPSHGGTGERTHLNRELMLTARTPRQRARGRAPRRSPRIRRADIARILDEGGMLPGIVFIFSRKGCDMAVAQCLREGVSLTNRDERKEIRRTVRAAISELSSDDLYALQSRTWIDGLERGIAAHHAGLIPQFKAVVEQLFQRRLIKLVFATETLALGINMPAKSVTIERLEKFNGEERVPLTAGDFTQLTGRAGRRGIDDEGHAIVIWDGREDIDMIAQLASARSFPVRSSFVPTPNMAVNLLQRVTFTEARDTLELSFAQFQADRAVVDQAQRIRAEERSLRSYEHAALEAQGSDRKRWEDRARRLRRQMERGRRRVAARTGSIARSFAEVVKVLEVLGYLQPATTAPAHTVTPWGRLLARIYGERDLLIAECLRRGVWRGIDAPSLAALACALCYEPRRESERAGQLPGGGFASAFSETLALWEWLAEFAERPRLGGSERPHAGLAYAMYAWARGWSLSRTLEHAEVSAGDFVRWARQTIDLLDQIAQLARLAELPAEFEEQLLQFAQTAREAKDLLRRGIVADSGTL